MNLHHKQTTQPDFFHLLFTFSLFSITFIFLLVLKLLIDFHPQTPQSLKAKGEIWLLSNIDSQEDIAYPNDPRVPIKVEDELKQLFRAIELPRDMIDIEKDLQKNGMKPATNTAKRRAMAQVHGSGPKPKPKKKKHEISKRTKLTNAHLPELFQNLNVPSSR